MSTTASPPPPSSQGGLCWRKGAHTRPGGQRDSPQHTLCPHPARRCHRLDGLDFGNPASRLGDLSLGSPKTYTCLLAQPPSSPQRPPPAAAPSRLPCLLGSLRGAHFPSCQVPLSCPGAAGSEEPPHQESAQVRAPCPPRTDTCRAQVTQLLGSLRGVRVLPAPGRHSAGLLD